MSTKMLLSILAFIFYVLLMINNKSIEATTFLSGIILGYILNKSG